MGKRLFCLLLTLVMLLTPAVSAYAEAEPSPAPEVSEAETAGPEMEGQQAEDQQAGEPEAAEPAATEPEQPAAPEGAEPSEEPGAAGDEEAAPVPEGEENDAPSGEDETVPGGQEPEADEPAKDEPAEDDPADVPTDEPAAEEPAEDEPAEEEPAEEEPAEEEPAEEEPAEEAAVLPAPELLALESTAEGVKLSWKPVEGAALYRILVKDGEEWAELRVPEDAEEPEETEETEYTLTAAVEGERYTLTVLAVAEDGTPGEYDEEGLSTVFELPEEPLYKSFVYINPLYSGIITEDDLLQPSPIATIATPYAASSVSGAASYLRGQMKDRVVSVSFSIPYSLYTDDLWESVIDKAYAHTGTANEGDYIAYHFGGASGNISGDSSGVVLSYTITYYSTQSQEQTVTSTLSSVMSSLNLSGKNDYQKIKAIYDWICSNVTYDYDHLSDPSYTLQFTAYAALIQKHAVCQGYASLFYRMALTAGVDARVVSGYGNGGRHAWDIVHMPDDYYYYVDSTWDAGRYSYNYFLKCQDNFNDHQNAWGAQGDYYDYTSSSWKSQYPIGPTDYDPSKLPTLSAPAITAADFNGSGIKVTWGKVSGAAKYRVFYKPDGGSWTKAGDTTSTTYTWTGAKKGTTYQIRVLCVSSDGNTSTSTYSGIRTVKCLAAPVIKSAKFNGTGINVTWGKVSGASKYRVFYKPDGGSWAKAGDTTGTSYTWKGAKIGTTYQIRVWCVSSSGATQNSTYDVIRTVKCLSAPVIKSAKFNGTGINVTWGKVSGASKYRVFYKPDGGSWAKAGDTTGTSYTWTKAKIGTTYQIRVWCVSSSGVTQNSTYDVIRTVKCLAAPKLTSVTSTTSGIKVTWNKVSGASKYRVFYKPSGGSWAKAGDTTGTSYTWTKAKSGTTYQIRVWCVSSSGVTQNSTYSSIKTITHKPGGGSVAVTQLPAPKLSKVENVNGGIQVTWGKVSGAAKYRVFYKPSGGSWTKAGDTTGTTYTWTGAKSGTTYQIRVWCVSSDGTKATSTYDTIKTIKYIAAPQNVAVSSVSSGIKVTWTKSAGAAKYRVFYKPSGGSWAKAGDTTGTSYTWTGAKNGTTYQIRVWCVSSDGKTQTSAYTSVKTIKYTSGAATVASGSCGAQGSNVTWKLTSDGVLTISGKGAMADWDSYDGGPWYAYRYDISTAKISSGVTTIGDCAFYYTSLKSVTIPSSVTSIGQQAFWQCSGLKSVTIPASVTSIGTQAFAACSSLTSISVASGNKNYCAVNGVLFNKTKTVLLQCPAGKTGSYSIPSGVTNIGDVAFQGCSGLTNVTIPSTVDSIGWSAFNVCTGLKKVTIPSGVISLEDLAFDYCTSLTSVTIPSSVTSFGYGVFNRCPSNLMIYGKKGSAAETYAAENGIGFSTGTAP